MSQSLSSLGRLVALCTSLSSQDCRRGQSGANGDSSTDNSNTAGVPLVRKLCYAVGGVPYQMTNVAIGFCLQIFLLDVVRMEAFFVSLILFLSRAWDAVTDPLVGYLVSRTPHTRIGKLLPWMVVSTPLGILSYVLLWLVPSGSPSLTLSVPWYLLTSFMFETFMSCYHVPYTSLSMFLGGHQRDRDSATAYRMCVEMVSMLLSSVVQGQVLKVFHAERDHACLSEEHTTMGDAHSTPPPLHPPLPNTKKAFMTSALVLGGIYFLCSLTLFLGVREQHVPVHTEEEKHQPYLSSLKMVVRHTPYIRLVLGFLFSSLAFQMSLGNFALYCTHASGLGAQFQYIILVLLIAAALSVPLWQFLLLRVGKRIALLIGLPLFIPAVVVLVCVQSNLAVYMAMSVLCGSSLATLFLLPWSMLPDVVDDFVHRNPCCREMEPLFFSSYVFCNKLGGGLSIGVSTLVLHFAGYKAGACSHGEGVVTALQVLFAPVPIGLLLLGLLFFYLYPIDEKQQHQDRNHNHQEQEREQAIAEALTSSTEVDLQSAAGGSLTFSASPGHPHASKIGQRSRSNQGHSSHPASKASSQNSRPGSSLHPHPGRQACTDPLIPQQSRERARLTSQNPRPGSSLHPHPGRQACTDPLIPQQSRERARLTSQNPRPGSSLHPHPGRQACTDPLIPQQSRERTRLTSQNPRPGSSQHPHPGRQDHTKPLNRQQRQEGPRPSSSQQRQEGPRPSSSQQRHGRVSSRHGSSSPPHPDRLHLDDDDDSSVGWAKVTWV
ncbi:sodium-dependent lysophosphatidylcholine symporter 1-like [Engraulis encrasicolus]|uniref:sodium-dependent lysophosphatidylcholine symporter 1-like n=1 Tax=Engraulis encrasicolus TaxID=184585 RepID=UPI002FD6A9A8